MITHDRKYTRISERVDNAMESIRDKNSNELKNQYLQNLGNVLKGKHSHKWADRLDEADSIMTKMASQFGSEVVEDLESVLGSVGQHNYLSKKYFSGKSEANEVSNKYIETFNSISHIGAKHSEISNTPKKSIEKDDPEQLPPFFEQSSFGSLEERVDDQKISPSGGFFRRISQGTKKTAIAAVASVLIGTETVGAVNYFSGNPESESKRMDATISYNSSDFEKNFSEGPITTTKKDKNDSRINESDSVSLQENVSKGNMIELKRLFDDLRKVPGSLLHKITNSFNDSSIENISEYSINLIKSPFLDVYNQVNKGFKNNKLQPNEKTTPYNTKQSTNKNKAQPEKTSFTLNAFLEDAKLIREGRKLLQKDLFKGPYENLDRIMEKQGFQFDVDEKTTPYNRKQQTNPQRTEETSRRVHRTIPVKSKKKFLDEVISDSDLYWEQVRSRNYQIQEDESPTHRKISINFANMTNGVGNEFHRWNQELSETSNMGYKEGKTKKRVKGLSKIFTTPVDSALGLVSGGRWGIHKDKIEERKKHNPVLGSIMSLYDLVEGEKEAIVGGTDILTGGMADKTVNDFIGQGLTTGINSAGHVVDYATAVPFKGVKKIEEALVKNKGQISQHAYETLSTATRFGGNVILHEAPLKGKYVEVVNPNGEREILDKGEFGATLESIAAAIIDCSTLTNNKSNNDQDGGVSGETGNKGTGISGSGGTGGPVGGGPGISGSGGTGGPAGI